MIGASATAERYFGAMRTGDLQTLTSLFAEHAIVNLPDGRALQGAAAIQQWFSGLFAGPAPSPAPGEFVVDGRAVAVEIQTTLTDGSVRRTANFFQLDDAGRITRLTSYARS